jgi:hypothetical protein
MTTSGSHALIEATMVANGHFAGSLQSCGGEPALCHRKGGLVDGGASCPGRDGRLANRDLVTLCGRGMHPHLMLAAVDGDARTVAAILDDRTGQHAIRAVLEPGRVGRKEMSGYQDRRTRQPQLRLP